MAQVQTLRSLCIIKVNKMKREGFEINEDIPQELVKDLMMADLFNGRFQAVSEGRFSKMTFLVSVTFDGVACTLSANILTTSYVGNPHSIRLCKFRVAENITVEAQSPLFDLNTLLVMMLGAIEDGGHVPPAKDHVMRLKLKINEENWRVGRMEFSGPAYKFVWRINKERDGSRYLSHHGVVTLQGDSKLHEIFLTSLHMEEMSEDIEIEAKTEELVEVKGAVKESSNKFMDPERYKSWQIIEDNGLKEFWVMVEVESK